MNLQPRNGRTGRFQPGVNSAPEAGLRAMGADDEALATLHTMTMIFEQIADVVALGPGVYGEQNGLARHAIAYLLIQLGEQAKRLGELGARHTEPGYGLMARQRDFLAHNTHRVDWSFVWRTASQAVPRSAAAHMAVVQKVEARSEYDTGMTA